jgi:predicted nucleic acid-binding protein
MNENPKRIFLDTNIFIIGTFNKTSNEYKILEWLGFYGTQNTLVEVVISEELLDQISRVAKRLKNKDVSGEILNRIWGNLNVYHVYLNKLDYIEVDALGKIPREDISMYLTAKTGNAKYFISKNRGLIRALVLETGEFECYFPEDFMDKFME